MVKIQRIGERRIVTRPQDNKQQEMINVTFIEEGRSGLNGSLADTSDFLTSQLGVESGLAGLRTHTQLLTLEAVARIKEGQELQGHINRTLTSFPVMRQQQDVSPRNIDGRPTYVYTKIEPDVKEDVDNRVSNEALLQYGQGAVVFSARLGGTEVRVVRNPETPMAEVINQGTV